MYKSHKTQRNSNTSRKTPAAEKKEKTLSDCSWTAAPSQNQRARKGKLVPEFTSGQFKDQILLIN